MSEEPRSAVEEEGRSRFLTSFSSAIRTGGLHGGLEIPEHGSGVPRCDHEWLSHLRSERHYVG